MDRAGSDAGPFFLCTTRLPITQSSAPILLNDNHLRVYACLLWRQAHTLIILIVKTLSADTIRFYRFFIELLKNIHKFGV